MNRITLLAGAAPGALSTELADTSTGDTLDAPALPALTLGLPAELARRRPDIAAAEAQLHAATARIGVAVADLYPRVTLGAGFGCESVGSERFGEWGSRQWHVGPSISLPIFDNGRRRATIELRELQQQEAAVAFQQTVLKAWHEIDSALNAYAAEGQRQVELAERERRGSRDALGAGGGSLQGRAHRLLALNSMRAAHLAAGAARPGGQRRAAGDGPGDADQGARRGGGRAMTLVPFVSVDGTPFSVSRDEIVLGCEGSP